jgi:CheY-like chemotaxis protein
MKKIGIISVEDSSAASDLPGASNRERSNPPHRILVVDDDNDVRQLSVDLLVDSGYVVESAKDGAAGWEALKADGANIFDLIITDNIMPRMSGIEMIEKIRDARMSLPIIMVTRYLPAHAFARKPWLRPDATLERPCSNDDLLATVKKLLRAEDSYRAQMNMLLPKYL